MKNNPGPRRIRLEIRNTQKQRMSQKAVLLTAAGSSLMLVFAFLAYFQFSNQEKAYAASNGDYRSVTSGSWSTASTWEKYNGSSWVAATSAPTNSNGVIEIQNGHTVTTSSGISADQVLIDAGGTLRINSSAITLKNGTGTDLTNNGTLDVTGTFTMDPSSTVSTSSTGTTILRSAGTITIGPSSVMTISGGFTRYGGTLTVTGTLTMGATGTYEHTGNGGTIPTLTWPAGSTCKISGITTTVCSGLGQSFKNLEWNCPNQTADINLNAALSTVSEAMTIRSTGTGKLYFDQQGNNSTLNIGNGLNIEGGSVYTCVNGSVTVNVTGDMNISGGSLNFNKAGGTGYGNTSTEIYCSGNLNVSGGSIDLSQYDGNNSSKGIGKLYLSGNIAVSGSGSILATSTVSKGKIYFSGSTTRTFTSNNNISGNVDFIVDNGATLDLNNSVVTGSGDFTLNNGGCLKIRSTAGITSSGASGDIQVTGTRTFNTGADYHYCGSSNQATGSGLPSTVRNFTCENSGSVTLSNSTTVSGTLALTSGVLMSATDTLTLGTSTASVGTLSRTSGHAACTMKRYLNSGTTSNVLFPVGSSSYYNGINFNLSGSGSAGYLIAKFTPSYPDKAGFPINDGGNSIENIGSGYWTLASGGGFSGWTYSVNLYANGFPGVSDYASLRVIRRDGTGYNWEVQGTHSSGTGSNSAPVANRSGMSSFGHIGIGSGSSNALPIKLSSWTAKLEGDQVKLAWTTASETNNDYFTVERSANGKQFEEVLRVHGSGTTNQVHRYSGIDASPLPGKSYYRLKQTDYDGKFTYSGIAVITVAEEAAARPTVDFKINSVYPNPFQGQFSANVFSPNDTEAEIELISIQGLRVYHSTYQFSQGDNRFEFEDNRGLAPGQYLLRMKVGEQVYVQKLIKN